MANDSEEISLVKEPAEIDTYSGQYQRPGERRPALVFLRGELLAVQIPLERAEVTLGRALDADIRINDSRASRMHARIITQADAERGVPRYLLKDLDSTNGTILNGTRIDQALLQDELTGLLTSKSFFSELRREAARAEAEAMPFCVLMMDIDYFKQVNDTYGHLVGSETLEDVGAVIKRSLRAGDVGARFGGEEFAAFLLDADYQQGMIAAERVRAGIEKHEFPAVRKGSSEAPRTHRMTISVGVAAYPEDARDPIQLVEMADSALYRAKRSGRNRVCAYRPAVGTEVVRLRPRA